MRRRELIRLVGSVATTAWSVGTRAQEPGRTYRLAVMSGAARQAPHIVALFDELKIFVFVDEQNLQIVAGGFDLSDDQLVEVAAALTRPAPKRGPLWRLASPFHRLRASFIV